MEFLIISGMSGAGKSKAAESLEDWGFYCVDNMPPQLIPKFAEIFINSERKNVVLVMDIRSGRDFEQLFSSIKEAEELGCVFKILFLDAKNSVLVNRYKETRRKHPMSDGTSSIAQAIGKERELLEPIRLKADYEVDTSTVSTARLHDHILKLFLGENSRTLIINVQTFGFKHGPALEADLMFDVRFLPNPYYVPELRMNNGTDEKVREYVYQNGIAEEFMVKLRDMLDFLIPKYIDEGKSSIVVAIGCTGGKHRSVAIGEEVLKHALDMGHSAVITHRDIGKV
ncbi:MAG: RNase adapter RapZ [Clostridia bacterium]